MPSPFPGMNPYLEQADAWQDFHQRFVTALSELIAAVAGPGYVIKLEAHVFIHEVGEEDRRFVGRGDIGIAHQHTKDENGGSVAVLAAPCQVEIPAVDFEQYPYIEIRDRQRRQLVSVVELLSPANKQPGSDREAYVVKRKQLLAGQVNYVEIDLLRGGPRMPTEGLPSCDYYVLVFRPPQWPIAGVWPIHLRDRLPVIPIPLRAPDPDVPLDLQEVLHRVYDAAKYENYIYSGIPDPPLSPENAEWGKGLIGEASTSL